MEAVAEIHDRANEALSVAIQALDKRIRPVQQAYFACCYACSDMSRPTQQVPECISQCQSHMIGVQEALGTAQETFQQRVGQCHAVAGAAVDDKSGALAKSGKPSAEQLAQYADALRPCVEREVGGIGPLLSDVTARIPKALADIKAATPAGVGQVDGSKKGWW